MNRMLMPIGFMICGVAATMVAGPTQRGTDEAAIRKAVGAYVETFKGADPSLI